MSEATFNQKTRELADLLSPSIDFDDQGYCKLDEDEYKRTLEGTDLDYDTVRKVQKHNTTVTAALALALGEKAESGFFAKHKDHDSVEVKLKLGSDSISHVIYRKSEVPDGKGGVSHEHGKLVSSYRVGSNKDKGELKRVRTHLNDLYSAAFGTKED